MMDYGNIIKERDMGEKYIKMVINMKDIGKKIKNRGKEF